MATGEATSACTAEMILVPELDLEISIIGEVRSPGRYRIRPGERLLEALAKAGGLTTMPILADADPLD